jgi:hypothetical protein
MSRNITKAACGSRPNDNVVLALLLTSACILGAVEQVMIARVNDWWVDELFALWASDRNVGFVELFRTRIASDSNPPLYFSLLHGARLLTDSDRTAVVALNLVTVAAAAAVSLAISIRTRFRGWMGFSICLFFLSGPVVAYLPEARSYCLAMAASYVAVMLASMTVLQAGRGPSWLLFALAGLVAGLSHVFAALLCCSVAAAMLGVEFLSENSRPRRQAIALAGSALASSAVWIAAWQWLGPGTLAQVSWIPFTASFVWEAGIGALKLTYGSPWIAIMFFVVLMAALVQIRSRRLALLITLSATLFIAVPILISFRVPIILTRYWLIGSPLFLPTFALLLGSGQPRIARIACLLIAAGLAAVTLPLGFWAAQEFVAAKPVWSGVTAVKADVKNCGPRSIHVLGFMPGFSLATGAPDATFVDAAMLRESRWSPSNSCKLLGWSEHYVLRFGRDYMKHATDVELLQLLKLPYAPDEVVINRHNSGFVVTRARGGI